MKLVIFLFFLGDITNSHAHVNATYTTTDSQKDDASELNTKEIFNFENPELTENVSEETLEDIIIEDLGTGEEWLDEMTQENEVLVYTDDEGNEYYMIEEKYAHANAPQAKVYKRKKRSKRNCVATDGGASWYGPGFHGRKTANGERFNQHELTAAHKTIQFNSLVRVTYKGQSVIVRINDAGPFVKGRVIDLSKAAAKEIGLIASGHGRVQLEIIRCGNQPPPERVVRITAQ